MQNIYYWETISAISGNRFAYGVCMCTCVYVCICIHTYLDIYLFKNICKYQHYLHVIYLVFMGHVCCN